MIGIFGRALRTEKIESGNPLQVGVKNFPNGIMVCQLWYEGSLTAVQKILVQR